MILGLLVLALVLAFTLSSKSPGPSPSPIPPTPPSVYNPYVLVKESIFWEDSIVKGKAEIKQSTLDALNSMPKIYYSDDLVIKADPNQIPTGINNEVIRSVSFEVGQLDFNTVKVTLTDSKLQRFSPPEDVVNKPKYSKQKRISMSGV